MSEPTPPAGDPVPDPMEPATNASSGGARGDLDPPPAESAVDTAAEALATAESATDELAKILGEGNESGTDHGDIDQLLRSAVFEDAGGGNGAGSGMPAVGQSIELPDLQQVMRDAQVSSIDLLRDVELNVKIELGRSRMLVEDVLKLAEGSVVELDKLAGDPVDVFVNDRLVARGEVLVLNDNFCVRVNEVVIAPRDEANG